MSPKFGINRLDSSVCLLVTLWLAFMVACAGRSMKSTLIMKRNDVRHVELGAVLVPAGGSITSASTRYCYFDTSKKCPQSSEAGCFVDSRPCHSNRSYLNSIYKKQTKYEKFSPPISHTNSKPTNGKNQVNGVNEIVQGYNIYNFNNDNNMDRSSSADKSNKQLTKRIETYKDYTSVYGSDDASRPSWLPGTRPFNYLMQLVLFLQNSFKSTCFSIVKYIRYLQNGVSNSSNM